MPRALTEKEKCAQCERLLEKGKDVVFLHGMRRVSVDDIARAAGMAKGTFYAHFETKERYLLALIEKIHKETFDKAKGMIFGGKEDGLAANVRVFFKELMRLPEMVFFIQNETEISLLIESSPEFELQSFKQMEEGMFGGLLKMAGIDTARVRPGVVHNCVHTSASGFPLSAWSAWLK